MESWSPYDEAVPQPAGLEHVRPLFAELRRRRGADPDALRSVREVVVVASSSRGGSTLLGALLRRCPGLVHLQAELNPHVVLAHLERGDEVATLAAELAADAGVPSDEHDLDRLADDVAWRLVAQWPHAGIDLESVQGWLDRADPTTAGWERRLLDVAGLDARWYDGLDTRAAEGPPGPSFVEMPPFVLPRPWRRVPLDTGTLVLTTPRSSFRLDLLRSLFPSARFRVLHLTRRPEASVNGLVDGWEHHGFYSCVSPSGRWWSFDYVPDWERWDDRPVVEICAEQWRQPHVATLEFLDRTGVDHLRLRHEDVAGRDPEAFERLADWLGVPDAATLAGEEVAPLMATAPPAPDRWRRREAELLPVLERAAVREVAGELGYAVAW